MPKYLILFAIVMTSGKTIWGSWENCKYYQNIVANVMYYVYNPEYPAYYTEAGTCSWYVKSATNVRLSCQLSPVPASPNCVEDRISISPTGDLKLTDAQNYCGTGSFNITSTGNNMNIVFRAANGTDGGRFLCTVQATPTAISNCKCGWKKETRIVGGRETGINEYPMMAGLIDSKLGYLYCGATIISVKHVLTAAHCVFKRPVERIVVIVGEHNITTDADTKATQFIRALTYQSHPFYDSSTQANDITVITLTKTIKFSAEVGPACLPFQHASSTFDGSKVDVVGWGSNEFSGMLSNVTMAVQLDVIPLSKCRQTFPTVTINQLCTFTKGKDTCQSDSGGPVLWRNKNTMRLVLIGVVSYGVSCGDITPGINTRVGPYLGWIQWMTRDINYCKVE